MRARWAACLLLAAAVTASELVADQVLEMDRTVEERQNGVVVFSTSDRGVLYLGENRARFDQGEESSWILLLDEKKLLFLRHTDQTYLELGIPVRLEDHLSEEERLKLAAKAPVLVPDVQVELLDESAKIGSWTARKVLLSGSAPEGESFFEYELWMSEDLDLDLDLYRAMVRHQGAVHFIFRGLASQMAALEGFPVLRKSRISNVGGQELIDVRRLVAVKEADADANRYAPPPGYVRVDFNASDWIQ